MTEVTKKPTSPSKLLKRLDTFPWDEWNDTLQKGLEQPYRDLVIVTSKKAASSLGATIDAADPLLSRFMTRYVAERVKQLNATTKMDVKHVIQRAFAEGTADDLGAQVLVEVREKFAGYEAWRAERIARSESAIAYNHANVLGYSQAGVEKVEVIDGTEDDICEAANGQEWTLTEALADPIGHPNCTRSLLPIVPGALGGPGPLELLLAVDDQLPGLCAVIAEYIASLDDPCDDRILDDLEED